VKIPCPTYDHPKLSRESDESSDTTSKPNPDPIQFYRLLRSLRNLPGYKGTKEAMKFVNVIHLPKVMQKMMSKKGHLDSMHAA